MRKLNIFILILLFLLLSLSLSAQVYLGVYLGENARLNNPKNQKEGLFVHKVVSDSPASKAGLSEGDVIILAGDEKVTSLDHLYDILKNYDVGDDLPINYLRNGEEYKTIIKLVSKDDYKLNQFERKIQELLEQSKTFIYRFESQDDKVIGVELKKLQDENKGLEIINIIPNSPAAEANLQVGDIIIKVDNIQLEKNIQFVDYLQTLDEGAKVKLQIIRGNKTSFIEVEVVERKSIIK